MNARLYDPALGRFLSPDPYVQAPDFTQNFNRYSYCLNNPLRYVDKNGEFFLGTILTFVGDLLKTAFIDGGLDPTSKNARQNAWRDFDPSAQWSPTNKAWKIDWGDVRKELTKWGSWQKGAIPFEYFLEFKSKLLSTERIQSTIGKVFAHYQNLKGNVEKVGYYQDRTIIRVKDDAFDGYSGVSWGEYVFGEDIAMNHRDVGHDVDLFAHEFSHTYQSRISGTLYLFKYGIPSAVFQDKAEKDANYRAYKNFGIQPFGDPMKANRLKWWEYSFSSVLWPFMWMWN